MKKTKEEKTLTQLQKELVNRMQMAGVIEECYMRVIEYLETKEQQKKMLEYLKQNPTASNRQVALKTKEITRK